MKKALAILPIVAALAACSSTSVYDKRAEAQRERNIEVQKQVISNAPSWVTSPPKSTENVIYATGNAASPNWAVADRTAIDLALGEICSKIDGRVKQQSKVYQRDVNGDTQEFSETTIKKECNTIDVTGYVVEDKTQIVDKNGKIRSYVLIAYPIGNINSLKSAKDRARNQGSTVENAKKSFEELDRTTSN